MLRSLKVGDLSHINELTIANESDLKKILVSDESIREGRVSNVIEKFVEVRLLHSFFTTGRIAPPSTVGNCNDEEYIGATFGFAQEISRCAIGYAIQVIVL